MKTLDLIGTAVSNTFRSKTRTILTILAIFVGAFTLTLTNGLGTGINAYIDDTVSGVGASDVMTVTKNSDTDTSIGAADSGPTEYDPDAISSSGSGVPGATVVALTPDDLDTLSQIDGVEDVQATKSISADYIEGSDGTKYVVSVGELVAGQTVTLLAGTEADDASDELQVVIPTSYVDALGFDDDADAVGQTVSIGITDATRTQHVIEATVSGVAEENIASPIGASIVPNDALTQELFDTENIGVPADQTERYAQASVTFSADATDEQISDLKASLTDAGYTGTTVADQLGTIKTVIDGIVLVLNAFAVIALLAASFGIVNTLLMSVQERTREIGLMKAMGMGSGKVFGLFSLEAAFIGFLGSAIGAGIAIVAGTGISAALSTSLLADLPGLTLIAFNPVSIATIILVVMLIAFLAGTLPAARAAKADPVESLRYE
ncbi:putative ABC transport system permease protein [Microbacterium endophyticum]|uniref:Putative ABC transport system permease protein n=1 Tax=Microbacterium endophyticum TaxID=1526412 RepID=A0A7W4V3R4_9MICO|nr:ABC transporter permease [Microbacterium endophyticum]MBB2976169.1 putative ABC transport system permease protein [Microbacterium endophyticum]NIK36466.1 putative ABC transport system permease protein [Microbacterium endophyticum]